MNPNKALWEKGDFTRLAESMRESGEALVDGLGITKGLEVLDLGCGDGTTALPDGKAGRGGAGRRYRQQPCRGGQQTRSSGRPLKLPVSGRRRLRSAGAGGSIVSTSC